eukprot:CAMPEP_0195507880 /NCGR_PEP_ID=MMETSP0794_2-20130614/1236_1 /TAXON_ID=515487 /ORGANISM="Stephanopyxis turris, Strain CCMP 815" /LENGTH=220 /DNA_ID=CAMNT_0040634705 /DNA_START=60 /DNA_END=719 /DNA_ORIENTATION=+
MADENLDRDAQVVKIVLLGDSGVGKSSLALRFVTNEFKPYSECTIGASFMSKTISVQDERPIDNANTNTRSKKVAFKIWDTAGQEKYHSLAPMYYRGAGAACLVYDICKDATYETLQRWTEELKSNGPPNIVLVVCGNKSDLSEYRQVDFDMAKKYADSIGAIFLETSAKADKNVQEIFYEVAKKVPAPLKAEDDISGEFEYQGGQHLNLRYEDNGGSSW